MTLLGAAQVEAQTVWDYQQEHSTFTGTFMSAPNWDTIAQCITAIEFAREAPPPALPPAPPPPAHTTTRKPRVPAGTKNKRSRTGAPAPSGMGTPPGEGEVGGRMREAVEECEEGVRRLRRRAVWLLLVAGAGDMALEHLGYLTSVSCVPGDARGLSGVLHGSISNSREGRASGAGLGSWEGAVEQMVARSCYLCAVHQRLHLTPDWVTTATTGVSL